MIAVKAQPTHLHRLTGLRFYAALIVVAFHMSRAFAPVESIAPALGFGYTGVSFFFILSGFVITWSRRDADTRRVFYWRRFARIWPLHALTTLLVLAAAIKAGAVNWTALPFVLTLSQVWVPSGEFRYAFNGVSWSLGCELFFYLLFPLLISQLSRTTSLFKVMALTFVTMVTLGLIGTLLFPPEALGYLFYTMPAYRLGEFIIGVVLALLLQRGWRPWFTLRSAVAATVASYVLLMVVTLIFVGHPEDLPYVVAGLFMLPGFVAIIVAAACADLADKPGHLRAPTLVRLGQWSFALYMIHEPLIFAADRFIGGLSMGFTLAGSGLLLMVLVLLSGVFYEFFERPIEKRLRGLVGKQQLPAAASKL